VKCRLNRLIGNPDPALGDVNGINGHFKAWPCLAGVVSRPRTSVSRDELLKIQDPVFAPPKREVG